MTEKLLSITGVAKHFDEIEALSHIDLDIHSGEVVGLVGSNGAGKTTLLRLMAGVYTPTKGSVTLKDGSDVTQMRHLLGVVPESTGLYRV